MPFPRLVCFLTLHHYSPWKIVAEYALNRTFDKTTAGSAIEQRRVCTHCGYTQISIKKWHV